MSSKTQLPDWDDMFDEVDGIAELVLQDGLLEAEYDFEKSKLIKAKLAGTGEGKSPSATSILAVIDSEESLLDLRNRRAINRSNLKRAELKFKIMQMQVDIYRTESANQRNANLP